MKLPARCCHAFILPAISSEAEWRAYFTHKLDQLRHATTPERRNMLRDDLRTLQLIVPLYKKDIPQELFDALTPPTQRALERGDVVWTCKRFDRVSGVCGIYQDRPNMCRTFPDNDVDNKVDGVSILCLQCTSTICKFHPNHQPA